MGAGTKDYTERNVQMSDDDMVPKSDLIAIKESGSKALGALKTEHASAITSLGEEHTSALEGLNTQIRTSTEELSRSRATIADLEEKGNTHNTTVGELETSKKELKLAQTSLKASQDALAGDIKGTLNKVFSIPEKVLEGKTVAELTVIRDALAATKESSSNNYTAGGGGGGADKKTTGAQKVKEGLEAGDLRAK